MTEEYSLRQLDDYNFEYDVAIPDTFIEEWLQQNFEEGIDFTIKETGNSLHCCTVAVVFLNKATALAFKLRWG